jgi:hypothetical protein
MAGNSDFTPGVGWTANPMPDGRLRGPSPTPVFIPVFAGQPKNDYGQNGDLTVDFVGRKIYEKTGGAWNAGTAF